MKLYELLKETFNAGDDELGDSMALTSYESWDSMAHMFFITKLEEQYGINLEGDDILKMKTVGDVKAVLAAAGKAEAEA